MSDIKREYSELKLARGLFFHQGHVLLVKNNQASGHFFLPGGKVDPGESVTTALAREFQEEIAWAIRGTQFLGCFEHGWQVAKKSGALVDIIEINFLWLCEKLDGPLTLENPPSMEEKISFQWVKLEQLDSLHILPVQLKEILPKLAKAAAEERAPVGHEAANNLEMKKKSAATEIERKSDPTAFSNWHAFWGTSLKSQVAKH